MIMKLKHKCVEIRRTPSFRLVVTVLVATILFKAAELAFGFLAALAAVTTVAAVIPLWIKQQKLTCYEDVRCQALTAIQNLFYVASMERTWSKETEERFSYARERALTLHKELAMRARHLDRCHDQNVQPYPGANWEDLCQQAGSLNSMVDSAVWICKGGLLGVNNGLLDPYWKPDFIIHDGKPEPEPPAEYRIVVPMAEFEHLRGHRLRPQHDAEVVVFDSQAASAIKS